MLEYINKQEILEKAKAHQGNPFGVPLIIEEIEKADALELVRCAECKHYVGCTCEKIEGIMDSGFCDTFEVKRPDDFCSYGERKDE